VSFDLSVSRLTSAAEVSRDARYPFFCTCAELAVVSRQKEKENKFLCLSDKSDSIYFYL
jgi:hypothetical protein